MADISTSSSQLRGLVGETLRGRYVIEGLLALDELGGRFAARQLQPERAVGLRVLAEALDGAAFERDSRTFTQLEHRGCLRILSVSKTSSGQLFLVTEAVTGAPLANACKAWSAIELLDAASQLMEVVTYAHQRGVAHGMLGPRSVFGETQGDGSVRVVVADFGLARLAGLGPALPKGTQVYGSTAQGQDADVAAAIGLVRVLLEPARDHAQVRSALALLDELGGNAAGLAEGLRALWAQSRGKDEQTRGGPQRSPTEGGQTVVAPAGVASGGKLRLPPLEPGRVVAERFRLEAPLGKGGMGVVWKATHLALQAPVAIKLLFPSQIDPEEARARFLREARASAALRSRHIVQVFDYGVYEGMPYLVMELLEGVTLEQRLEQGAMGYEGTLAVMRDVCAAIGRAHELDVIHRDLKPANIFLVSDEHDDSAGEQAKVLDFGIAKFLGNSLANKGDFKLGETKTGALLGTPYYMSPEQLQESKSVDHRSDLWALGVIAFQCLTGQRPFDSGSLVELCISITTKDAPDPEELASVPGGVGRWMRKALSRDPAERFDSAKDMLAALENVGDAQQVKAPMAKVRAPHKRSSAEEPVFDLPSDGPELSLQVPAGTARGVPGAAATTAAIGGRGSPNVARERNLWPLIMIVVGVLVLGVGYLLWAQGTGDDTQELADGEPGELAPPNTAPAAGEQVIDKPVSGYGDDCAEDSECAWDDPCVPTACVAASKARSAAPACEEAGPEPGTCGCIDHRCVLRREQAPSPGPSCANAVCGLDQARGVCVAGKMEDANEHLDVGPACLCEADTKTCELNWIEALPCKSTKDCWVTQTAPFRPIARAKQARGQEFRPCRDGEFAPTCRGGQCALISYSCD